MGMFGEFVERTLDWIARRFVSLEDIKINLDKDEV